MATRLQCGYFILFIVVRMSSSANDVNCCGPSPACTVADGKICPNEKSYFKGICLNTCPVGFYNNDGACVLCGEHCSSCEKSHCLSCHGTLLTLDGLCHNKCDNSLNQTSGSRWTRLVKGRSKFEGKVEVYYNGTWGTICGDKWDMNAAKVVCSELRLGDVVEAKIINQERFVQGDLRQKKVWLSGVVCSGTEKTIFDCHHQAWGSNDCSHLENVGIRCSGPDTSKGCVKSCEEGYRKLENTCVPCPLDCATCNSTGACLKCAEQRFLEGTQCVAHCKRGTYGKSKTLRCEKCPPNCTACLESANSSAINCYSCQQGYYLDGSKCVTKCKTATFVPYLRLSGNNGTPYGGLLEVRYWNRWHSVCDHSFDRMDAIVICRELGYGQPLRYGGHGYGYGTGLILTKDVACTGSEKRFIDCTQDSWFLVPCFHTDDIGLTCSAPPFRAVTGGRCVEECEPGLFLSSQNTCELCNRMCMTCEKSPEHCTKCRAPLYLSKTTCVPTCANGLYANASTRVCLPCKANCLTCTGRPDNCQSCRPPLLHTESKCVPSCPSPLYRKGYDCVKECGYDQYGDAATRVCHACPTNCLKCYKPKSSSTVCQLCAVGLVLNLNNECVKTCPTGYVMAPVNVTAIGIRPKLRLTSTGISKLSGRLEVLYNGTWGSVCDDKWSMGNSKIACAELLLGPPSEWYLDADSHAKMSISRIWLDDVVCRGTEQSIFDCEHNPWGVSNCYHSENVHLKCSSSGAAVCQKECPTGYYPSGGVCEPCDDGCLSCFAKATNCTKCIPGYHKTVNSTCFDQCPIGSYVTFDKHCLPCDGKCWTCDVTADNCTSCRAPNYLFQHKCIASCSSKYTHIRGPRYVNLVQKKGPYEGVLEVTINGKRGEVCDWWPEKTDGDVFCKQLNMGVLVKYMTVEKRNRSTPAFLYQPDCLGSETSFAQCRPEAYSGCWYSIAYVQCTGPDTSRACVVHCDTENGYVVIQNVCHRCASNCLKCEKTTANCTKCREGWVFNGTNCVLFCPYGTYYVESLKSCQPCGRECLACDMPDSCTNCAPDKYLDGSSCKASCKDGFKTQIGVEGIRLSSGRVEILVNRTWAMVCGADWNLNNAVVVCRHLGYGNAIKAETKPFYRAYMVLKPRQCTGNEENIFKCREGKRCLSTDYAVVHCSRYSPKKQCVKSCGIGFYSPPGQSQCKPCSPNCLSCAGRPDNCVTCYTSYFLDATRCTRECPKGYYGNVKSSTCEECDQMCRTCLNGWSNNRCSSCNAPYFLRDVKCVDDCYPDHSLLEIYKPATKPVVRLINGSKPNEGFAEVFYNGHWGQMCFVQSYYANAICRNLGYKRGVSVDRSYARNENVPLLHLSCDLHSHFLSDCAITEITCSEPLSYTWVNCSEERIDYRVCRKINSRLCNNHACSSEVGCVHGDGSLVPKEKSFCIHCPEGFFGDGDNCTAIGQEPPAVMFTTKNVTAHLGGHVNFDCHGYSGSSDFFPNRYSWTLNGKLMSLTKSYLYLSDAVQYGDAGRHVCTLRNSVGSTSITFNLKIEGPPVIVSALDLDVTQDTNAIISCRVVANPPANITWYYNGSKLEPSSDVKLLKNGSVKLIESVKRHGGQYKCEAKNVFGSSTATITVRVPEEPGFEEKAKDVLVERGGTAKFCCKPLSNDPPLKILWRRNGETLKTNERIRVTDQNELIIENVSPEDCGEYYCVAKNDQVIATSVGTLIIKDEPPCIHTPPQHLSVQLGMYARFYCKASGSPKPVIHWLHKKHQGGYFYEIKNATLADVGVYICHAQSGNKVTKAYAFLTVDGQYACPYMIQKPMPANVSVGSQATFQCDGIAIPNFKISWDFRGKEIEATKKYSLANGNRQLTINDVQANDAGKYTCFIRSQYGQQSGDAQLDVDVVTVPAHKSTVNTTGVVIAVVVATLVLLILGYFVWRYRRDGSYPSDVYRDVKQKSLACFTRASHSAYAFHHNDHDDAAEIITFERNQQF